ncbi:hypothetical protein L282_2503 [Escherichia coli APEC IMT5155]|nr:hypothetical protein L282_2503 [Escherichia coli APEC IMT5155]EIH13240.1 hypothetical protein EC990741_4730 [Escherichia coli 97.0259]KDX44609.1 hypothetical protein AC69_4940 [Escherichia coli 2-177-06_S4_C1]
MQNNLIQTGFYFTMAIPEQSVQIIKDISQQHSTLTAQK